MFITIAILQYNWKILLLRLTDTSASFTLGSRQVPRNYYCNDSCALVSAFSVTSAYAPCCARVCHLIL
jgi:hypothetical protein